MKPIAYRFPNPSRQRGVVLVLAMILLLILTMIGLSAVRGTTQQQHMGAASQQQTLTFQAADSAIHTVMNQLSTDAVTVANAPPPPVPNPLGVAVNVNGIDPYTDSEDKAPTLPTQIITVTAPTGDTNIVATARIYFTSNRCPLNPMINSTNKFNQFAFNIDAVATETGTGATSRNIQQICRVAPPTT